jgi:hypothetical protein
VTVRDDDTGRSAWGTPLGRGEDERRRASKPEVLGAWLGLWTPPRGVDVPPFPRRKAALVAAATLVVLGAALAVIVPQIDRGKTRGEAERAREERAQRAALRRRILAEQAPRRGRLTTSSRVAALQELGIAIQRDARARFSAKARPAECTPAPGEDPQAVRLGLRCDSATADIIGYGSKDRPAGELTIPYAAVVDFAAKRYTFCKVNPPPGERVIPDPRRVIALPKVCLPPGAA